jgi:dedicator of cytokinesis protein 3
MTFRNKVSQFLEEVELFIALLESVRELPQTPEWAEERSVATYQMLDFIRRLGRQELYIRFIHQLRDTFLQNGNYTSAGISLKLHAELYEWKIGGEWVDGFKWDGMDLPPQSQFGRKEALYYHALNHFGESFRTQ